jgi:CRISPR-associated protein Cmr5
MMNAELPMQQTMQQKRAAHAYNKVNALEAENYRNRYGTLVRGLPAMIQTDGIGQTLAFLLAKAKTDTRNEHYAAYTHLEDWLRQRENFNFQQEKLIEWLLKQPSDVYRQVATEAQAYLSWLKRFVEAKGWKSEEDE